MPAPGIVTGQRVLSSKVERAKELRSKMTQAERLLWHALRRSSVDGLHFRRQQVIAGFIVDFYCHAAGLIVEVDGPIHEEQTEGDEQRDAILSGIGLRVLRIKNEEVVSDLGGVVRKIIAHSRPNPLPLP